MYLLHLVVCILIPKRIQFTSEHHIHRDAEAPDITFLVVLGIRERSNCLDNTYLAAHSFRSHVGKRAAARSIAGTRQCPTPSQSRLATPPRLRLECCTGCSRASRRSAQSHWNGNTPEHSRLHGRQTRIALRETNE